MIAKHPLYSVLPTVMALGFIATSATAQEPPTPAAPAAVAADQCTGEVSPAEIPSGESAFRLTVALSSGIGAVTGVDAPEGSGLALAAPESIPRAEMANATEPAKPIELAADTNTATVWLTTADAKQGEVSLTLRGETGTCSATVTVK